MQLLKSPPTVTTKLRCPIDVGLLESYAAASKGNNMYYTNKAYTKQYNGKTVRDIIHDFLTHVTYCEKDRKTGYIDICYKFPKRTARSLMQDG